MAKILVTGGCGYIGCHATKALTHKGHQAVVFDNLSTGHKEALLNDEELIVGDLQDATHVDRVLKDGQFDAIMHFAASIVVPESVTDPLKYYRNNTANLLNLMESATRHGVYNVIFSSTAAVYGNGDGHSSFSENDPPAPVNPYGFSKYFSEQIIRDTSAATDMKHVILRYFNVAGADSKQRIGQRSPISTHLIKIACEAAVGIRDGMTVYGNDYETHDGTALRDYIHVDDLADAHVLALEYLLDGGKSQTINCGYGQGFTVREVLETVESVIGRPLKIKDGDRRPGDAVKVLANTKKIHQTLDWTPRYQDLPTIVRHAYLWEQRLKDLT